MGKIDRLKELLNSLRTGLSIISAFLITLGGVLGHFYNKNEFGLIFWIVAILFFIFLIAGFVIIHKIKIITNELEEL